MVLGKLPPNPNSNANPKPNPDPFLGGNFPDTFKYISNERLKGEKNFNFNGAL